MPPTGGDAARPGPEPPTVAHAPAGWKNGVPAELPYLLGRYRLLRLLGQGGMGAVYLAHDTELDRPVAIKVPRFAPDDSPDLLERFFREARSAATLSHPNICKVYEVGQIDGVHYLAMAYIEGKPLQRYIDPRRPAPQRPVAIIVRQLALAMQVAHEKGIIHRDLKPANILIDARRQPIIMDFGLARRVIGPSDLRLTQRGALLGTPAYMSPEQVNGDVEAMGPGCDIYSLGIILYELLTGRLPFQGPLGTLLAQIVLDPPPPPSRFQPDLDPALEAACLKALAKKPAARYRSMTEFADALRQYLTGGTAPVTQRPAGPATVAVRATRIEEEDAGAQLFALEAEPVPLRLPKRPVSRRRLSRRPWWVLAFGLGAAAAAVLVLAVGGLVGYLAMRPPTSVADSSGPPPDDAPRPQTLTTEPARQQAKPPPLKGDANAENKKATIELPQGAERRFEGLKQGVSRVVCSADGRRIFACGQDGVLLCWDVADGKNARRLGDAGESMFGLAFTPTERQALTACRSGVLRLWDLDGGKEVCVLRGHTRAAVTVAFSPGGRHVVSAGDDGAVCLWDFRERRVLARLPGNEPFYGAAAFSPDCRFVATVGADFALRLWDLKTGEVRRLPGHQGFVVTVVWSPDGRYLLSASHDKTVRLWDVQSGREVRTFPGHTAEAVGVAFSPDGSRALSGGGDRSLRLWDVATGRLLAVFEGPDGIGPVAFSPDGRRALTGHCNGDVFLWRLPEANLPPLSRQPAQESAEPPLPPVEQPPEAGLPPKPPPRLPVPGQEELAQADTLITKKYFAARPSLIRDNRLKVVADLRKDAADARADATTRYALWRRARDVAVKEGDLGTALATVTDLTRTYDLDARSEKGMMLSAIAPRLAAPWAYSKGQPVPAWRDANRDCAEHALGLAEDAVAAESFTLAQDMLHVAETVASRVRNGSQLARARTRLAEVKLLEKERKDVEVARAQLQAKPRAAAPGLVVGRYLALTAGRWADALPLLAQAGDPRWKAAAKQDLGRPSDAAGRVAVGDAWWTLGEAERGKARARLYWRACIWYEGALPRLEGAARARAEERITRARGAPRSQLLLIRPWSDADLTDPKSGFPVGTDWTGDKGYRNGRWFMQRGGGWMYRGTGHCPASFACRVVGRVTGPPSEGWTLEFAGIVTRIDSEGRLHRCYAGQPGEEICHRVIRPHGEPNDLLLVVRGRHMEIYVNGLAVRDPLILDQDVLPTDIGLRIDSRGGHPNVAAEFERFTLWPADDLPPLEARAAAVP